MTGCAINKVFKSTNRIPRMIKRVYEETLIYASQQQKRFVDKQVVQYVTEHKGLKRDE